MPSRRPEAQNHSLWLRPAHLAGTQILDNGFGVHLRGFSAFLGMDSFEHVTDPRMDHAATPPRAIVDSTVSASWQQKRVPCDI